MTTVPPTPPNPHAQLDRMTVLVISPVASDPAHSGNAVRTRQVCTALEELGATVHFCLVDVNAIRSRQIDGVLDEVWGSRFHRVGEPDTFKGTPPQRVLRKAQSLVRRLGVPAHRFLDFQVADGFVSRTARRETRELVDRLRPDAVVMEYALLSRLVVDLPGDPVLIVDAQDRFTDRKERLRAAGLPVTWVSLTARQERRLLRRFDQVIAIQEEEGDQFRNDLGADAARVTVADLLVSGVDAGAAPANSTVGYIGSDTALNRGALHRFLDLHWRDIRATIPDARLLVAGAHVSELDRWRRHGVETIGRVPDLTSFYAGCSVIVNPVESGSGLKIKSVEALQHGRALVTTPEGIRGLRGAEGTAIRCAHLTDPAFGHHVTDLLAHPDAAAESGAAGRLFIDSRAADARDALARSVSEGRIGQGRS